MSGSTFIYTHRVTYAECTVGNHIYYGRYLDLLEAARGEFFRQLGTPFLQWQEQDRIFPVVECRLRYHSPARYDDTLRLEIWLTAAEGVRLNFGYRILQGDGALVLSGETQHVCTNVAGRPKRLPAELLGRIEAYLGDPLPE